MLQKPILMFVSLLAPTANLSKGFGVKKQKCLMFDKKMRRSSVVLQATRTAVFQSMFKHPQMDPKNPLTVKRKQNQTLTLERNGLVTFRLNFDVSQRRELNIKTKSRSFKTFYKIESENLRVFLEQNYGKNNPQFKIEGVTQTFKVSIRGILFNVVVSAAEMGEAFNTDKKRYLKYLVYASLKAYQKERALQGLKPDALLEGVVFNNQSLLKSSGAYLMTDTAQNWFTDGQDELVSQETDVSEDQFAKKKATTQINTLQSSIDELNLAMAKLLEKARVWDVLISLGKQWREGNSQKAKPLSFVDFLESQFKTLSTIKLLPFENTVVDTLKTINDKKSVSSIFKDLSSDFVEYINEFDGSEETEAIFTAETAPIADEISNIKKRIAALSGEKKDLSAIISPSPGRKSNGTLLKIRGYKAEYALYKKGLPFSNTSDGAMTPFSFLPLSSAIFSVSYKKDNVETADVKLDTGTISINDVKPSKNEPSSESDFIFSLEKAEEEIADIKKKGGEVAIDQIVIESRQTIFSVSPNVPFGYDDTDNGHFIPMVFSFNEDGNNSMQQDIDYEYLMSILNDKLFHYIYPLHSAFITYRSVDLMSYEAKEWSGDDEDLARSSPLRLIQESRVFFRRLLFGSNSRDIVNARGNLMYSSLWEEGESNTNPNRFLTCSAYESQLAVRDDFNDLPGENSIFTNLEMALNAKIIISQNPKVILVPCFERGLILQTGGSLVFRGLVNNSSSSVSSYLD